MFWNKTAFFWQQLSINQKKGSDILKHSYYGGKKNGASKTFVIVLLASILIFSAAGIITARNILAPSQRNTPDISANIINEDVVLPLQDLEIPAKEEPAEKEPIKGSEKTPEKTADEITFSSPLTGEIITPHSTTTPIYSETMGDFRIHKGIDIKGELSSPVLCAADGIIEDITEDSLYGITVIVDHNNGIKTKYQNLSSAETIKIGNTIKKGERISGVGSTAQIESKTEPHLHFEVIKDGKHINPADIIDF